MKIGFQINNISDEPNGLPSIARFATLQILPSDLARPIDEFIALIRPVIAQCKDEFDEMAKSATEADIIPFGL